MKKIINFSRNAAHLQGRNALGQFVSKMYEAANVRVSNISKNYVGKLYTEIIKNSPVETGAFRRSIRISMGRATNLPFYKSSMGKSAPPAKGSAPTKEERKQSGYDALFSKGSDTSSGRKKHLGRKIYYITATVLDDNDYSYGTNIEYIGWRNADGNLVRAPYMPFKKALTKVMSSSDRFDWRTNRN